MGCCPAAIGIPVGDNWTGNQCQITWRGLDLVLIAATLSATFKLTCHLSVGCHFNFRRIGGASVCLKSRMEVSLRIAALALADMTARGLFLSCSRRGPRGLKALPRLLRYVWLFLAASRRLPVSTHRDGGGLRNRFWSQKKCGSCGFWFGF